MASAKESAYGTRKTEMGTGDGDGDGSRGREPGTGAGDGDGKRKTGNGGRGTGDGGWETRDGDEDGYGDVDKERKMQPGGLENLKGVMLTRAPLGYFYNAPHWGGGGYFEPPSDLRNYWTDSKNSSGI